MMFMVQLKFGENKGRAGEFMDAHNAWISKGFEDGVFLLVGSLKPAGGGVVLVHNIAREVLESRLQEDPFVSQGVVCAEVIEFAPARTDLRLDFLKN